MLRVLVGAAFGLPGRAPADSPFMTARVRLVCGRLVGAAETRNSGRWVVTLVVLALAGRDGMRSGAMRRA